MLILVLISLAMFLAINVAGIARFGFLTCLSEYGMKWEPDKPNKLNLWSYSVVISAMLLIPPIIQTGENSPLQFLCFFAPLNLFVVGITPDYESSKIKHIIHIVSADLSSAMITVWSLFIVKNAFYLLFYFILATLIYVLRKDWNKWLYYAELVFYLSTYSLLILILI